MEAPFEARSGSPSMNRAISTVVPPRSIITAFSFCTPSAIAPIVLAAGPE